ncbi:hypothetical protein HHK36_026304 [Tetracentron sinense]|uniref:Pectinesterase n=1 Tax=Tetracentron sinense TaxID=13715 RepID=A0A834YGL5_TETSI|nr:hypothetical protein HHK36_026304 [Tetracentron sinense]
MQGCMISVSVGAAGYITAQGRSSLDDPIGFVLIGAVDCSLHDSGDSRVAYTVSVTQTGEGNFQTIQAAIDSIPEKVTIPLDKPCILLEGDGRRWTAITWDDHDQTNSSATFTSYPDNFVARDITFMNTYNHKAIIINDNSRTPAVSARIYGDKSSFHNCAFIGLQDTLWDATGRHYFNSCYIEGAVDFIFGSGQSIYENCEINVTAALLEPYVRGYITAQGRNSEDDPSGFVFRLGIIHGSGQAYLGRAYGAYSRVIFYGTTLSGVVASEGWDAWHYSGHEGNVLYAEASCNGAGANISQRVEWEKQLNLSELTELTSLSFIDQDGWLAKQP